MNKLLVALIACGLASLAAAQTAAPRPKADVCNYYPAGIG